MAEEPKVQPAAEDAADGAGDAGDVRSKFREALERKNARHHGSESADPGDDAKSHGGSAPARAKRQFRRKSG